MARSRSLILFMERQTGPREPEAEKTSMKAALAAASDGGYYVGRVNASAGRVRPGS